MSISTPTSIKAVFIDSNAALAACFEQQGKQPFELVINRNADIKPTEIPAVVGNAQIIIVDHTALPTDIAKQCTGLRHVVFLGTGARSYMNPEELAAIGIEVHIIKGYGDLAVAEFTFALLWDAAKGIAAMDGAMRQGNWVRTEGQQIRGKTVGLIGFGGIAQEFAGLCKAVGMNVIAYNRSPKTSDVATFVSLEEVLKQSDFLSVHLTLGDETRGFLKASHLPLLKKGVVLLNTARAALIEPAFLSEGIQQGIIAHASMDVFDIEPLPADSPVRALPNTTLTAHSAFRTPESNVNLVRAALAHCNNAVTQLG